MRIDIPKSSNPITRLLIDTPLGRVSADFAAGVESFDYEIPEGVSIDQIGVSYEFLNNGQRPVGSGVLKYAIEKPVEEPKPIIPVVDIPEPTPEPAEDCECGPSEACSNCDPEDEIAAPKVELDDE